MPMLSNGGTYRKKFYNLQVDFSKRPQYTRTKLSRCTRANHFESRSQRKLFKLLSSVYKRATSFRYWTYVENWLYVGRHGWGGSFLCRHVTRSDLYCSGAACQFCKCSVAFLRSTCMLQYFDTCSADCRLIANWNSYMGKTQSPSWFHNLLTGSGIAGA